MTTDMPLPRPCGSCPYRRDVPAGIWHESEYVKLPLYDLDIPDQPTQTFSCHQQDGHLCAGWVGVHDMSENLAVRIAVIEGRLASEDLPLLVDFQTPVPLFASGRDAATHGLSEIATPGPRARRVIEGLKRRSLVQ